jgi:DNA-binding LytR/AlgR family response regulator
MNTLLIIEDDPVWQLKLQMMVDVFKPSQVIVVQSLEEASKFLSELIPDLVLCDVVLPDGFGFSLFRNQPRSFPVVFLTSHPEDHYLNEAFALQRTSFLIKPFHSLSLQSVIYSLLPKSPLERFVPKGIYVMGKFRKKVFVNYESIVSIEADGNYIHVHTTHRNYTMKHSLRKLIEELDVRFVQIQKAFIVNIHFINRIDLASSEVIANGRAIPLGRAYRQGLLEAYEK